MKDALKQAMGQDDSGDMQKNAKLKVLQELRKMASDMMGGDVKDGMMKKVSVAAPDQEGLKAGLEKAQQMVGDKGPMEGSPEEEALESPGEEMMEDEDMENCSPEEIDAKIAKLQDLKKKLKNNPSGY